MRAARSGRGALVLVIGKGRWKLMISVSNWLLRVSYGEDDRSSAVFSRGRILDASTASSHGKREYYRMGLKVPSAPTMGRKNPPSNGAAPPPSDHRGVPGPLPTADHIAPTRSTPVLAPLGRGGGRVKTQPTRAASWGGERKDNATTPHAELNSHRGESAPLRCAQSLRVFRICRASAQRFSNCAVSAAAAAMACG